ncbi:MAG TPA: neutral zinc metallopeptidase [Chitinophagales bacterium]|nr:neutral zinc metallopeptidase [Chitinophagales bacterium]
MRWGGLRGSGNVEDRRGMGGPMMIGGGLLGVVALVINFLMGGEIDMSQIQQQGGAPMSQQEQAAQEELAQFVSVVLAETEDVWNAVFSQQGADYPEPKLVMFSRSTQSGCGFASAASGPFYCPADQKVYIDLSFYNELKNRFGADGDFAMAYVIAHEVGHHIQTVTGTSEKIQQLRQRLSEEEYNRYSVAMELQADFLAGVWAHHEQKMKNTLEPGDLEEALKAAAAIGDDQIQMKNQGYTVPESFTHGTSEQRMYWFKRGYQTGDISQGNTFAELGLR